MTRLIGRPYNPWIDLRNRPGIRYGECPLPGGMAGMWLPDICGIAISSEATRIEQRCALAHVLVHAEHGHAQCAGRGPGIARNPSGLERWTAAVAAARLVPLGSLMSVLAEGLPPAQAATEVGVTERVLHVRIKHLTPVERCRITESWGGLDEIQLRG